MNPNNPEFHKWHNCQDEPPRQEPGVYAIFGKQSHGTEYYLLYIGSTGNLALRIANHEVIRNLKKSRWDYKALYWIDRLMPEDMEFDFIGSLKPLLNKSYK